MTKATDLFETVSAKLITAITEGQTDGNWKAPWVSTFGLPVNAVTRNQYQGFNSFYFTLVGNDNGYLTPEWATYRQWDTIGAQVRKGEKSTLGIKWGFTHKCDKTGYKGQTPCGCGDKTAHTSRSWASTFNVFNADQVDGYEPDIAELPSIAERLNNVEGFVKALPLDVRHGGSRAYFRPGTAYVTVPDLEAFHSTTGYYSTLLHEITHWSGDTDRLNRDQNNRFGSAKYAAEELVAEMGSAFLLAHFNVEAEPHIEHAQYLTNWLGVLQADPMNLYRAAKLAQDAANFLLEKSQALAGAVA